jgi:hypothetical protein
MPEHWSSTPESNRPVWFNACALPRKWQHAQINAWTNEGMIRGFCFCNLRQLQAASFCRGHDHSRSDFAVTGNRFPRLEWNRISRGIILMEEFVGLLFMGFAEQAHRAPRCVGRLRDLSLCREKEVWRNRSSCVRCASPARSRPEGISGTASSYRAALCN